MADAEVRLRKKVRDKNRSSELISRSDNQRTSRHLPVYAALAAYTGERLESKPTETDGYAPAQFSRYFHPSYD